MQIPPAQVSIKAHKYRNLYLDLRGRCSNLYQSSFHFFNMYFSFWGVVAANAVQKVFLGVYSQGICCVVKTFCSFVSQQICLKGKVHIFKFLSIQACLRIDKKPDSLDLPSLGKRIPSQPLTDRWVVGFLSIENIFWKGCLFYFGKVKLLFLSVFHSCGFFVCRFSYCSMEDFYPNKNHGPDSGIGSDNGDKRLSTTEVSIFSLLNF